MEVLKGMGERKSNKQRIIIFVTVLFIAAANIITIILVSNTEDNYNKLVIDSDSQKIESEIQQNNKLESIKFIYNGINTFSGCSTSLC